MITAILPPLFDNGNKKKKLLTKYPIVRVETFLPRGIS